MKTVKMKAATLLSFCFYLTVTSVVCLETRYLGAKVVIDPGFTTVFAHDNATNPQERYSIVVSTFTVDPRFLDEVYFFEYPGKFLDNPINATIIELGDQFVVPREPNQVPETVFGTRNIIAQPCGFLFTGKDNGTIVLVDISDRDNIIRTDIHHGSQRDNSNYEAWWFNRVIWVDGDGDGNEDAFTCRTRLQNSVYSSEFLWYTNPGIDGAENTGPWAVGASIVNNLCDTFLREVTLDAGGQSFLAIYTTGYFFNDFSVFWTIDPDGLWSNPDTIQRRQVLNVTDDLVCVPEPGALCGHVFDVYIDDLNRDGRPDLLLSINSGVYGSLIVLEIPDDFRTGEYTTHILAQGFKPRNLADNGGSPGQPRTFFPTTDESTKPWLLLSGDDDARGYYFEPLEQSTDSWSYNMTAFNDQGPGQIVGTPAAFDSDGDGYTELFQPCYSANLVRFYTFAPTEQ